LLRLRVLREGLLQRGAGGLDVLLARLLLRGLDGDEEREEEQQGRDHRSLAEGLAVIPASRPSKILKEHAWSCGATSRAAPSLRPGPCPPSSGPPSGRPGPSRRSSASAARPGARAARPRP